MKISRYAYALTRLHLPTFCMSLMVTGGVFGLTLSTKKTNIYIVLLDFLMQIKMWCLLNDPQASLWFLVEFVYTRSVINSS